VFSLRQSQGRRGCSSDAWFNKNNDTGVSENCLISFENQYFLKNSTTNGTAQMVRRFHWWWNFFKILIFK